MLRGEDSIAAKQITSVCAWLCLRLRVKAGTATDSSSIPVFTELPNGVRLADIRPGSPAAKARLKPGDIPIAFDGKPIQNLYDFTYALRAIHPGQEVLVKVLCGNQTIEAKVLLTVRG